MSGTDRSTGTPAEKARLILNELRGSNNLLRKFAEENDWTLFNHQLVKRQELLAELKKLMEERRVHSRGSILRGDERQEIQNLIKENEEIYDILNRQKDELMEKIMKANKGLEFLKGIQKTIEKGQRISKTY